MKRSTLFARCSAVFIATAMVCAAQAPATPVGVWVSLLAGQTGTMLTLSDDSGQLGGTVVLNGVNHDGRIMVSETHLVLNPRLTGKVLLFQVKSHRNGNGLLDFRVVFNTDHTAQLHCENCGDDAPVAEMTKSF